MQCALFLDVVVAEGAAIFELLAGEDKTLLVRRNALLVLDLGFHIVDRVAGLDLEGNGLAREGLYEAAGDGLVTGFGASELRVVERRTFAL